MLFLFPLLFTLARGFSISRHPATDWFSSGSPEMSPTCEELQEFWQALTQTARMGPETNEISVMPVERNAVFDNILTTGKFNTLYRKYVKEPFSNRLDFIEPFSKDPWAVQAPVLPNSFLLPKPPQNLPPQPELEGSSGIFGEFHDEQSPNGPMSSVRHQARPSSSSSVPLGDKKNGESEYYIPQWGSPEDVGIFGSFVDFDVGSPHLAITRTPKGTAGVWSDLPHGITNHKTSQVTCDVLVNSHCTVNEQCICKGRRNLHCIRGKCLNYDQNSDVEKHGIWHDGPIPELPLRLLAVPRKRSYRSIFM